MIHLLMTVHNGAAYIAEAIESIRNQTYHKWRLIVADDGSYDETAEIIKRAKLGGQLVYMKLPKVGRQLALKAAESHIPTGAKANGQYVGWIDADDILEPDALKLTLEAARKNKGAVIYTQCQIVDEVNRPIRMHTGAFIPFDAHTMLTNFIPFHFRLIPAKVYTAAGGIDETLLASEDFDLCLRLSEQVPFVCVPRPLYRYRKHNGSISSNHRRLQLEEVEIAIKRALSRRGIAGEYSVVRNPEGQFGLREAP